MLALGGQSSSGPVLELWAVSTGKLLTRLNTSATAGVLSVAFSPDSTTLLDGGSNGTAGVVELWTISTGKLLQTLNTAATVVNSVAYSPAGNMIADGGANGKKGVMELWSLSTSNVTSLAATDQVASVAFSPDGTLVADGDSVGALHLWTAATGKLARKIAANPKISCVAFSPDGKTVANTSNSGITDGTMYQWSIATGKLIQTVRGFDPTAAAFGFSPDGIYVALAGISTETIWPLVSGHQIKYLSTDPDTIVTMAFSPNSAMLAVGMRMSQATLWQGALVLRDAHTGKQLTALKTAAVDGVVAAQFSADGATLIDAGVGQDSLYRQIGILELWNVSTGKLLQTLNSSIQYIQATALSRDGKTLAVGGQYSPIELWNLSTGKLITTLKTANIFVDSLAFSPDGKTLADVGDSVNNGQVELWNVATGALSTLTTDASFVDAIVFTPDGQTMVVCGDKQISSSVFQPVLEAWNVSTGSIASPFPSQLSGPQDINSIALSSDGKTLFAGSVNTAPGANAPLQIFSMANYGLMRYYDQDTSDGIGPLAVSPDGSLIAYLTSGGALVVGALQPFVQSITLSPSSVTAGTKVTATVTLVEPAPKGGLTVGITGATSTLTCPSSVAIAAGSSSASFTVTPSKSITSATSFKITASLNGGSESAVLTVQPNVAFKLAISPGTVKGGAASTATITLSAPAPSGGLTISLTSDHPSVASFTPATVTIAAGKTSGTATIYTSAVTASTNVKITATLGTTSTSVTLKVTP
jgi:WD40 repeat protein